MANGWDDDDDFDTEDRPSRGEDSNALRSARKAERAKDKELRETKEALAQLQGQLRERAIKDAVKERNLNPKIAKLVPADIAPDGVEAWISDYADVFGAPATQTDGSQETPGEGGLEPIPDPAIEALARIGAATAAGQPYQNSESQMLAKIASAQSVEELNVLIHGNAAGPATF